MTHVTAMLGGSDELFLFDLDDFGILGSGSGWRVNRDGYVVKNVKLPRPGGFRKLMFHRMVLGLTYGDGKIADHINRNRLDCRRANLRVTDKAGNARNSGRKKNNTSGYKGVYPHPGSRLRPWVAQVGRTYLGCFETAELAAQAYDVKAKELYGEFASLNFPKE